MSKKMSSAAVPAALAGLGLVLLALGFLWQFISPPEKNWSRAQAKEYSAASLAMHGASHPHQHDARDGSRHNHTDELAAARQRFDAIKQQLDQATERPQQAAYWLKVVGGLCTGIAAVALLSQRTA